jgi:hypothetical protein
MVLTSRLCTLETLRESMVQKLPGDSILHPFQPISGTLVSLKLAFSATNLRPPPNTSALFPKHGVVAGRSHKEQ